MAVGVERVEVRIIVLEAVVNRIGAKLQLDPARMGVYLEPPYVVPHIRIVTLRVKACRTLSESELGAHARFPVLLVDAQAKPKGNEGIVSQAGTGNTCRFRCREPVVQVHRSKEVRRGCR